MFKVYVDGQHGTTGLLVNERLKNHPKVEILDIPFEERHNKELRIQLLNEADVVFLCLPDDAAKESVALITNPKTKIIDASTAHRVDENWTYGLPELNAQQRVAIEQATYVTNPGCHSTAAIIALYPLIQEGILSHEAQLTLLSVTGYSGGGKQMIETYEKTLELAYKAPRQYAFNMNHKHIPEMMKYARLETQPLFMPIVSNFERGLAVTVPLAKSQLNIGGQQKDNQQKDIQSKDIQPKNNQPKNIQPKDIVEIYKRYYADSYFIQVHELNDPSGLVDGGFNVQGCNQTNNLDLYVYGNDEQFHIISRLDNLGKGASGAAIQNMNIMLGIDEKTGL